MCIQTHKYEYIDRKTRRKLDRQVVREGYLVYGRTDRQTDNQTDRKTDRRTYRGRYAGGHSD